MKKELKNEEMKNFPKKVNKFVSHALSILLLSVFSMKALAVATPSLSISGLNTSPLKGEALSIDFALDNTGADTGYFPYYRLIIPEELSVSGSSCELGSATVTQLTSATSVDPYNGEAISLSTGETLVVILPPTGHISPTQGTVNCSLNLAQTPTAVVGTPFDIKDIEGIFALGDQPNGEARPCGSGDTVCDQSIADQTTTPQLIEFQVSDPATTVTGPNNTVNVSVSGDLADGETLNGTNIVYSETLSEFAVLDIPAGDCLGSITFTGPTPISCTYTPNGGASLGGGSIVVDYGTTLSADFSFSYPIYIVDLDDSANPANVSTTGVEASSTGSATFTSDETGVLADTVTYVHRSLETTKSNSIFTNTPPSGYNPGDTIQWTITTEVSDYFSFDDYVISDVLGDGLQFENDSLTVTIIEDTGAGTVLTESDLETEGHLTTVLNGDGTTDIDLNLGDAMANAFFGLADDVIGGASTHGTGNVTTRVVITYRSLILDDFTTGTNTNIDVGARIENQIDSLALDLLHETPPGSNVPFTSPEIPITSGFNIVSVTTFAKSITHINGIDPGPGPYEIAANDLVTFKVSFTLPAGGMEQLKITDFVPSPIFAPSVTGVCLSFDGSAVPAENQWSYGTNDLGLADGAVTANCSIPNGSIELTYPNTDSSVANQVTEVLFTLRANNEPIADGLQIVNSAKLEHQDEEATATATASAAASFVAAAPVITINHVVDSATKGNTGSGGKELNNTEAGAVVTFRSELANTGNGTAQDLTHELLMIPDGYTNPNNSTSCSGVAACGYNVNFTGDCGTPVTTATDEDSIIITGMETAEGNTCTIEYDLLLEQSVQPDEEIEPEIKVTWTNGGTPFAPKFSDTNTEIIRPSSTISMTTGNDQDGVPGDVRSFDANVTIPEGTTQNFRVRFNEQDSFASFDDSSDSIVSVIGGLTVDTINAQTYYCTGPASGVFDDKICFQNDPTSSANLTNSGNNFTIDLGETVNGFDNIATDEVVVFSAIGSVNQSATDGNKRIRTRLLWDNPNNPGNDLSRNATRILFAVNSPKLVQQKCVDTTSAANAPFDLNESVDFIVKIKNEGSNLATAFDVTNITDSIMAGVTADTGSLEAYYCDSGASADTCTSWPPVGCTSVSPVATGNIDIPVVGAGGNPDIEADGYFAVKFTSNLNCSFIPDTANDPTTSGSHPGSGTGGLTCVGLETAVPFGVTQVTNTTGSINYSSLDGVVSGEESYTATGDSITPLAIDHDGDGIATSDEGSGDADGDGVPNYLDTDADDNGIIDSTEGDSDNDSDGTPDYRDTDDDGDGDSDAEEIIADGGSTSQDTDGDGDPDYLDPDSDGDGIADGAESAFTDAETDSEENAYDRDSDNDGIPDIYEFGLGSCDDGSGSGTANNSILEPDEIANCSAAVCVAASCDSDGNGAIEADELVGGILPDADGDGIPNAYDFDSDNDGLPDFYENLLGQNSTSLGIINLQDITDTIDQGAGSVGDGFVQGDTTPSLSGELVIIGNNIGDEDGIIEESEILDTDNDGIPNFLDTDSDNDGVPDIVENNRASLDEAGDADGEIDYNTEFDASVDTNFIGPDNIPLLNTDSDDLYNYLDIDSDNDGLGDWIEAWPTDIDTDDSGDISASEFAAAVTGIGNNDGVFTSDELVNTDSMDLADIYDTDSDNDGILDEHETDSREALPGNTATVVLSYDDLYQSDGDSDPDFRDTDSDGDGIDDSVEAGDANPLTPPVDSDSDGIPDSAETDSDNDGLSDADELIVDPTGTSKTNPDTDGDMCNDGCEVLGDAYAGPGVCPYVGQPWASGGSAASPITDILDPDTDDGGANDCDEANDGPPTNPTLGNGGDDAFNSTLDTDMDGLTDFEETTITMTDPFNAYSDSDSLHDGCEVLGSAVVSTIPCPITGASGTVNAPYINPNNPDTDGGGIPDDVEVATGGDPTSDFDDDTDGDGIGNLDETNLGLDPNDPDSNDDCINDGDEIGPDVNNPLDTDNDGIPDIFDNDNDNDGLTDCEEIRIGSDPASNADIFIQGSGGCSLDADASVVDWTRTSPKIYQKLVIEILMLLFPILIILGIRNGFQLVIKKGGVK